MDYIIIGGDERFAHLARLLRERGRSAGTLYRDPVPGVPALETEALARAGSVVVNCPPRTKESASLAEIAERLPESARVYLCGLGHPAQADGRTIDLWSDEELLLENARLTAEGAVCAAMTACGCAIRDARCMVVGWGRIGRALTEILVALGARVTAVSRREGGRNRAVERGAEAVDTGRIGEALPGHRLIFNTAPAMVLDRAALARADSDALLIDLASPPYGVDLRAAWDRGLRAWREPGLPGRYCPQSAALALLRALRRSEKEREQYA